MRRWSVEIRKRTAALLLAVSALFLGCVSSSTSQSTNDAVTASPAPARRKLFILTAEDFWRVQLADGKRFDASALAWDNGRLLTLQDGEPGLHEIQFDTNHLARLRSLPIFTPQQMDAFTVGKLGRFDLEGMARDDAGRIYVCEEANRWIFRWDPATKRLERLDIDWTPVRQYFSSDDNASFEGIAVGGGKLWLANERDRARIIEVDLQSLKILGDFAPAPSQWAMVLHYSDLCWFKGHLFVLLRHHHVILELDPATREVLAEYNFHAIEDAPEHEYHKRFPTGTMEGLAIDDDYFWLITDNNGLPRMADSADRRPTLFKCKRPR
jgi:hypothetical protein